MSDTGLDQIRKRNIKKILAIIFSIVGLIAIITTVALIIMNTGTDGGNG